jgi:hypothetical protein
MLPGVPKNNSEASEAITLKYILLDRGKANLDFDIFQLYIYKKLTEILMFKFDSIFLDVSEICRREFRESDFILQYFCPKYNWVTKL